jgi:hypothetical protein
MYLLVVEMKAFSWPVFTPFSRFAALIREIACGNVDPILINGPCGKIRFLGHGRLETADMGERGGGTEEYRMLNVECRRKVLPHRWKFLVKTIKFVGLFSGRMEFDVF